MGSDILSVGHWRTNADLICEAVVPLGYLDMRTDRVLDCTWGLGAWWAQDAPDNLTACDLEPSKSPLNCPECESGAEHPIEKRHPVHAGDSVDFRSMPFPAATFTVVAFDAPYVPVGSNETSTLQDYNERYGRHLVPSDPSELQAIIDAGLADVMRVLVPGGRALVKCASYVWSGNLYPGSYHTLKAALDIGFELVDWFVHEGDQRAQPQNRTRKCRTCKNGADNCPECHGAGRVESEQQHARQNSSVLYVFAKPKPKRGAPSDHPSLFEDGTIAP